MSELPDAIDTLKQHQERMREWWGLRPSTRQECPTTILGPHRRGWNPDCLCQKHHRILDHRRSWITDGGRVFTAEPYDAHGEELAELIADCERVGLRVRLSGTSTYYPLATVLILIYDKPGALPRGPLNDPVSVAQREGAR